MDSNGFERFSKAWKKADAIGHSQKMYSENEIKTIKMKKSLDFSKSVNNSILFDVALKSILIFGMLLLAWFYWAETTIIIMLFALMAFSIVLLIREVNIRQELHMIEDYTSELGTVLKRKIQFYKVRFPAIKGMIAFTNALFVWIGSTFYQYSKYGYYKLTDTEDIIVTVIMISLAFGISYLSLHLMFKLNIRDLEESLLNLHDQEAISISINAQLRRKKRFRIAVIIAIIVGLALFLFFLLSYLN